MKSTPKISEVPAIDRHFACIVPDNNPMLGALVSTFFNERGVYFPVFAFPNILVPPFEGFGDQDEGYIGRGIGLNAAIVINNAIVRLGSQNVFFAGLSEVQKKYMYAHLPRRMVIEIDSAIEVQSKLAFLHKHFDGEVACRPADIIAGMLQAKYTNKRLTIDDNAPKLPRRYSNRSEGLLLVETKNRSQELAAVNYAFSINADVVLVPAIERSQVNGLQKLIHEWKKGNSQSAYNAIKKKVAKRVKGINFLRYQFATFFTYGLPYGLIIKNLIPVTHVLINFADIFLMNNMLYEHTIRQFGAALVFSPKEFSYEETEDVIRLLQEHNYLVKPLTERKATLRNLDNYGSHYPYDILHICSHGGETDGYYVVQKFKDRMGDMHTLEYEEVIGVSPESAELVRITKKAIFRRLDGCRWMSPELKKLKLPQYVYEDLASDLRHDKQSRGETIRVKANYPIYTSCHIKCYDSIHQGDFRTLASHSSPFVFNNTCSSWHEIAVTVIAAGARAYIGTLWDVGNITALQAAKKFYLESFANGSVLSGFTEMNRAVVSAQYQNVYILWGLHFSTFKHPKQISDERVFSAVTSSLVGWYEKYMSTNSHEVRRNCVPIMRFLLDTINREFSADHQKHLPRDLSTIEREITESPLEERGVEQSLERGVMELNADAS